MAEGKVMTKGGVEGTPVDLQERVTLYAPKGAAHHTEGEKTEVAAALVDQFISLGFSKTAPKK